MYLHDSPDLQHISIARHQGKLLRFGVKAIPKEDTDDAYYGEIYYSILETGQEQEEVEATEEETDTGAETGETDTTPDEAVEEDSFKELEVPGHRWSSWKLLPLPDYANDPSVLEKEAEEAEVYWEALEEKDPAAKETFIATQPPVRSRYHTAEEGAFAPIQTVMDQEFLYIFRQSLSGTLLADRFVLDGVTNQLIPKLDIRFRRSRQKYTPLKPSVGAQNFDAKSYRDLNGDFFYEPSKELTFVGPLYNAWFSVVMTPTYEHDKFRWHFFYYNAMSDKLEVSSVRKGQDGWFDLSDYLVAEGEGEAPEYRVVPGIIRRQLHLTTEDGTRSVEVVDGFSATLYSLQDSAVDEQGEDILLKTGMRVMLTFPSSEERRCAAINFTVHRDGTLSKVAETPTNVTLLKENRQEVLLPGNMLNQLQPYVDGIYEETTNNARNGLSFAGAESIEIAYPFTGLARNNFSITAWLRPNEVTSGVETGILGEGVDVIGKPSLFMTGEGKLRFALNDADDNAFTYTSEAVYFANADEWVHIGLAKSEEAFHLFRNGILTDTFAAPAKILDATGSLFIGQAGTDQPAWNGEIAAVSCWKKALAEVDVAELMGSNPMSKEALLIGFWALQGVVEGETFDFSPLENHGQVHGAYPTGSEFAPTMADGTAITSYRHDEVVGVSQRATYVESVEFLVEPVTEMPVSLSFKVWGKEGRNGDIRTLDTEDMLLDIEDLDDGWKRANIQFAIPDGMSHLRYCEIEKPEGNWNTLKLRKHQLYRITQNVTQADYVDELRVQTLGDVDSEVNNYYNLNQNRQQLTELEIKESVMLQRLAELDQLLGMDPDAAKQALTEDIAELSNQLEILAEEKDDSLNAYEEEVDDPFNYYCSFTTLYAQRAGEMLSFSGVNNRDVKGNTSAQRGHLWKIVKYNGGYCRLRSKDESDLYLTKLDGKLDIQVRPYMSKDRQKWYLEKEYGDVYAILSKTDTNKCAHLYSKDANVYLEKYNNHSNQRWRIKKYGKCNLKISIAEAIYKAKHAAWSAVNTDYLQKQIDLENFDELIAEQNDLLSVLNDLQEQISDINTTFLSVADILANEVLSVDQDDDHGYYQDDNTLSTTAALLDFAKCHGRLNAYESFAGAVQLDFFMESGGMRSCYYDAINERWRPNLRLSCLSFGGGDNDAAVVAELKNFPAEEITFELWAKSLEAKSAGTLLSYYESGSGDRFSIADAASGLTITVNGVTLETGVTFHDTHWHHLALSMYAGEKVLRLFRDGEEVFILEDVPVSEIASGGNLVFGQQHNEHGEYVSGAAYRGKLAEVRLWSAALSTDEIGAQRHFQLAGYEPNLVAYWPMSDVDQVNFTFKDHALNGSSGQCEGNVTWFAGTMPIGQLSQTVLETAPDAGYVQSSQDVDLEGGAFTIEYWAKRSGETGTNQVVLSHGNNGDYNGFKMGFTTDGYYFLHINGMGPNLKNTSDTNAIDKYWHHYALTYDKLANSIRLYQDGRLLMEASISDNPHDDSFDSYAYQQSGPLFLGLRGWDNKKDFGGCIADVRIWETARSAAQIKRHYKQRLSGKEADLLLYWPLDEQNPTTSEYYDRTGGNHGLVKDSVIPASTDVLPLPPADALLSGEYAAMQTDRQGVIFTLLRRVFLFGTRNTVTVVPSCRIEELERRWLGNAQFAPTLLGYMEGAPPVPSENLTEEADYRGATSVELKLAEDTTFRWERSQQAGVGWNLDGGIGWASNTSLGGGVSAGPLSASVSESISTEFLTTGSFNGQYSWLHESEIESQVGLYQSHRLALKGKTEDAADISEIGPRYIPKNVGYAAVVSSLADVFVYRLRRSGIMVGYEVTPVADIPPDINTITFMMNPAYTMNGSLDGQVGMQAADDEFYSHVPDMRTQYGSLYPASYYRLKEAYDLKQMIEEEDARRESLYMNYNSNLVDEGYLNSKTDNKEVKEDEAENAVDEANQNTVQSSSSSAGELASWQEKMEKLATQAQKQNIVNTYVWDGDGGLRSETQQFSTTVQQTIGGSFSMDGGVGFTGSVKGSGIGLELSFMATFHLTQTTKKAEKVGKGFSLEVKVDCENEGITDQKDYPLLPGQKVDRYRFMSFYLAPKTDHFSHFFDEVVDPEWLISNDEEARTLREIDRTAPNKTWRVMHRVTYVERPALAAIV